MPAPADAYGYELGANVPASASTVTLRLRIQPRWAAVNLSPSKEAQAPIHCEGPGRRLTIGYGNGTLYVEKIDATAVLIDVVGWD